MLYNAGCRTIAVRSASEHRAALVILLLVCFLSMYVRSKPDLHQAQRAPNPHSLLCHSLPPIAYY